MCLKCVRGLIIDNTFHCTRTEVVVVGFTARITGGSSGTGQKRNRKTDWGRKQTNTDKQTYFFTPLQSISIMFSNPNIFASFVIVSSLLPSCRVVTASVSLLRTLSPTSLVASILSLYDVKGFSLQKYTQKHRNICTDFSFSSYSITNIYKKGVWTLQDTSNIMRQSEETALFCSARKPSITLMKIIMLTFVIEHI